jgi:hypothetical protein
MREQINFKCVDHPNTSECPDKLIGYSPIFDEYGILIHDGGSSSISIKFCPWCGTKLPESKRDLWFDTLEELGFDDPFIQDIPKEFETDEWFKNR